MPIFCASSENAFSAAARLSANRAVCAASVEGATSALGERRRHRGGRRISLGARATAIGGDPPAVRSLDPVGEILQRHRRPVGLLDGHEAEGEAMGAVGRNAAADRRPFRSRAEVVGVRLERLDCLRSALNEYVPGGRDRHVLGEHRRDRFERRLCRAGGREAAVRFEQPVDRGLRRFAAGLPRGEQRDDQEVKEHGPIVPREGLAAKQ